MANKIILRDCVIKSKNFSGKEKINKKTGRIVNSEGNRNFLLIIPEDMQEELYEQGYNIGQFSPDEVTGAPGDYYLPVTVGFKYKPPVIWLITRTGSKKTRARLDETTVKNLDEFGPDDLFDIKVCVRPVNTTKQDGTKTIKAYLETMYATCDNSDPFYDDYDWDDEEAPFEEDYE
jgi:hypothetical protein